MLCPANPSLNNERTDFITASIAAAGEVLSNSDMQAALDQDTAAALQHNLDSTYSLTVDAQGITSIPKHKRRDDDVPILALRPDEQVERDASFALFTPAQWGLALTGIRAMSGMRVDNIDHGLYRIERVRAFTPSDARMAQVRGTGSCWSLGHEMDKSSHIPKQSLHFNLRPLIIVPLGSDEALSPSTLAAAYIMYDHILSNPVVAYPKGQRTEVNTLETRWQLQAHHVGATVAQGMRELGMGISEADEFHMQVDRIREETNYDTEDKFSPNPVLRDILGQQRPA